MQVSSIERFNRKHLVLNQHTDPDEVYEALQMLSQLFKVKTLDISECPSIKQLTLPRGLKVLIIKKDHLEFLESLKKKTETTLQRLIIVDVNSSMGLGYEWSRVSHINIEGSSSYSPF